MNLFLLGPTAIGKTRLSYECAALADFEIISVDSSMIYQGVEIGVAKPNSVLLQQYPHHFVSEYGLDQNWSVGDFFQQVSTRLERIEQNQSDALFVGGTMMYFNALFYGLNQLPKTLPTVRDEVLESYHQYGLDVLYQRLLEFDLAYAKKIKPTDKQRILRALEVYQQTQNNMSWWQSKGRQEIALKSSLQVVLLPRQRGWLHGLIAERFEQMISQGLIEETQTLLNQHQDQFAKWSSWIGYAPVVNYLQGKLDRQQMIQHGIVTTRQYAKRQLTWLRKWCRYEPQRYLIFMVDEQTNYTHLAHQIMEHVQQLKHVAIEE